MSRKRRTPPSEPTADPSTLTAELPVASTGEPAVTDAQPGFAERVRQNAERSTPDPFGIATDAVAGVRLFESRRDRQMAIRFEEKPSQAVLEALKDAGYRWEPADKVWVQPLWPASAMTTRIRAEELYQEVCRMIRKEKGIEPDKNVPF